MILHSANGGYKSNHRGILRGSAYTATAIVYPSRVLKIDRMYPMMVADLPLLTKICTKLVIPIWAMPHPTNTVHMKAPLV